MAARPATTSVGSPRTPSEWGRSYHLWRDSMNPTMTAAFMRAGRLAHVSDVADNLFLCGRGHGAGGGLVTRSRS